MAPLQDGVPGVESVQTKSEGGDFVSQCGRMSTC
jgi:hypothetical protein